MKQVQLFAKKSSAYGGSLLKTCKGRSGPRPLATRDSMHLVLRSSKARGEWSFFKKKNARAVNAILSKFSQRHFVRILSKAIVGNHIHLHIQLRSRSTYKAFIRAITSAIAMAITGASRWRPLKTCARDRFWDLRPFTRIVQGFRDLSNLKRYIELNQLEVGGFTKDEARFFLAWHDAKDG